MTRAKIDEHLPPYGTSQNPVDGTAQAVRNVGYSKLNRMVMDSPEVDAIIGICSARHSSTFIRERNDLLKLKEDANKPVVLCSYTLPREGSVEVINRCGLPLYTNMRNCARALREMADYRRLRESFLKRPNIITREPVSDHIGGQLAKIKSPVCEYEAKQILAAYGIPATGEKLAKSPEEAAEMARSIGGKLAMKIQSPDILHKTEADAVALNVQLAEVESAFKLLTANARAFNPNADIRGILLQPMASKGQEVIIGINRDEAFGPILMVGMGGILVEIMKDVAFAPAPLVEIDAYSLLERLQGRKLLDGIRGQPATDIPALVKLMVNLSRFAADFAKDIQEIDLNPVIVHPKGEGVTIVDALIVKTGD